MRPAARDCWPGSVSSGHGGTASRAAQRSARRPRCSRARRRRVRRLRARRRLSRVRNRCSCLRSSHPHCSQQAQTHRHGRVHRRRGATSAARSQRPRPCREVPLLRAASRGAPARARPPAAAAAPGPRAASPAGPSGPACGSQSGGARTDLGRAPTTPPRHNAATARHPLRGPLPSAVRRAGPWSNRGPIQARGLALMALTRPG
mmetsp:Transcript_55751/g.154316  ORF Transcript_55751/g.154316 Transcript_55751/m.154316 type:complete len:204 (-) Transcript_55751:818-1429(-)